MQIRSATFAGLAFATVVSGCLPSTTATMLVSKTAERPQMLEAERIVESLGFCRLVVEPASGESSPRLSRAGTTVAGFQSCSSLAFGVSVSLLERTTELRVVFAERNSRFSPEGERLLQSVLAALRARFGEQVTLIR